MIELGRVQSLTVLKGAEIGYWLDGENLGEVFLPRKWTLGKPQIGEKVDAFVFSDSKERLTATMRRVKAQVGEFACLKVSALSPYGAFLDIGVDKDVLVPLSEQKQPMEVGRSYLVYVYLDDAGRMAASNKTDQYLNLTPAKYSANQPVKLMILNKSDLGYNAIIEHKHAGVLYQNEVFERLSFGQFTDGFIKQVRSDGKIDLMLQSHRETLDKYAKQILSELKLANGFLPLHDKTDAHVIKQELSMSKGAFKKAIGGLYRQKYIRIERDGIYLVNDSAKK
ncbi:RNA binding S1 [Catenovulum agarivorans DS-2]|uniref:RNA binding S1 n=1 Tax=Catenovulum agarivorans DS-2 TaxID=1328313 RepID=W7QJP6_9ALTE|nr:S1-like domain-containing RNA-binding protein [Catenovulum agarivorans]EWH08363.1 RNA binding S1 [Catenovulum agarivorans DS-2]